MEIGFSARFVSNKFPKARLLTCNWQPSESASQVLSLMFGKDQGQC